MGDKKQETTEREDSRVSMSADQEELGEFFDSLPMDEKNKVIKMMSMQVSGVFSPQNEIMKKITSEHITDFINVQSKATDYQFKESRENKVFGSVVLVAILIFVIVVIILLKDLPDIMEKILYAAGGLIAGAVGGYGFGKNKRDE